MSAKKDFKIVLFVLSFLILTALFFSVGCGSGKKGKAKKVVLRFSTFEPAGEGMVVLQKIIDQFEIKYPNIEIKVEQEPGVNYSGKVLTQIAGGSAPDVINMAFHTGDLPLYVKKGALLCLDDFVKTDTEFKKGDYFAGCIKACSYQGKLYAVSKDGNPYILFYNKTLFNQAGLSYPNKNWTWDDFLATSRKLTKFDKSGRPIVLGGGYDLSHFYTLLVQNRGKIFSEDLKSCLLDNPQALAALKWAIKFRQENLIPSNHTPGISGISGVDLFSTGKIAMLVFIPAQIADSLKKIKNFEWDIAPIPIPKGGVRFSELIHVGYSVSSTTKHPKESWEFIKWLGGPVGQEMMASLKYGVPAIRSISYSNRYAPPPEHIRVAVEAMEYAELFPAFEGSREVRDQIMIPTFDRIYVGLISPEQGIKEMTKGINEILKSVQSK